jgi:hypothetical protein
VTAKYRIEILHDPHSGLWPWDARVTALDGSTAATCHGETQDEAREKAAAWVRAESAREPNPPVYYADESGHVVPAPAPELSPVQS